MKLAAGGVLRPSTCWLSAVPQVHRKPWDRKIFTTGCELDRLSARMDL